MKLSEMLVSYRKKHHLNKGEMARHCGISSGTLAWLENPENTKLPSINVLLKLFTNLDISEKVFLDVIKNDVMFHGLLITWMWDERLVQHLMKYYKGMNRQGRELALAQVKLLAESNKFI